MTIGFVFSGQGAQYAGMGEDLYNNYPIVKEKIDLASEILDLNMPKLLFTDNPKLNETEYTQPAILTLSCAVSDLVKQKTGIKPSMVAGLSLGEYSALVEAGALSFEDALVLVKKRGKLMEEAVPKGLGAMSAVMGLDRKVVEKCCLEASHTGVVLAVNYNMPGQIAIAGEKKAVEHAEELLAEAGAKRVIRLNVSGPFHTPLLEKAAESFLLELNKISFNPLSVPVVTNVTGEVLSTDVLLTSNLAKQIHSPVYWEECVKTMVASGVNTMIELGPGKTLCSFIRKIDKSVQTQNVDSVKSLETLEKKLEKWGQTDV